MSDLRSAAQQALKALAGYRRHIGDTQPCDAEIALLDALAQQDEPVQEPVAWIDALKDAFFEGFTSVATYNDTLLNSPEEAWENYKPPRAAPPQRKPLTEEMAALTAQRDAVLEALTNALPQLVGPRREEARAAIKAVEETK